MVELESNGYHSPRASYEYLDCSLPLTFDQYSICSFNCLYCFAFYQRAMNSASAEDFWDRKVSAVDLEWFKKLFDKESINKGYQKKITSMIKQGLPLHWGGLSDPGDDYEKKFHVGLDIIKFLKEIEYPTLFSVKGDAFLQPEYLKEFDGSKNFKFQMSITSADDKLASQIEMGAPAPSRRLLMMKTLSSLGCECMLRLRPYIIGYSDKSDEQLIVQAAEAGATAVSVEFFCLERRAAGYLKKRYEQMNEVLGFNVYDYYKHLSRGDMGGYARLNPRTKATYIERIYKLTRKLGIRFACSDAHFKELNDTGCCCGLDNTWNWSRGQFTNALIKCRKNGTVCFKDIDQDRDWEKEWKFSEVRNCGNWKRYRKFKNLNCQVQKRNVWNDPNDRNSPYRYFEGRMVAVGLDENQDVIYKFVKHELEDKIIGNSNPK